MESPEPLLFHLDQIGLVTVFRHSQRYARDGLPKRILASYFGESVVLEFTRDDSNQLPIGKVIFTQVGEQLAPLCVASPVPALQTATIAYWQRMGVFVLPAPTDTTFYIIALYFGSVGVKKTRHAVACGLITDLAGVVAAIVVAYIFWGR